MMLKELYLIDKGDVACPKRLGLSVSFTKAILFKMRRIFYSFSKSCETARVKDTSLDCSRIQGDDAFQNQQLPFVPLGN